VNLCCGSLLVDKCLFQLCLGGNNINFIGAGRGCGSYIVGVRSEWPISDGTEGIWDGPMLWGGRTLEEEHEIRLNAGGCNGSWSGAVQSGGCPLKEPRECMGRLYLKLENFEGGLMQGGRSPIYPGPWSRCCGIGGDVLWIGRSLWDVGMAWLSLVGCDRSANGPIPNGFSALDMVGAALLGSVGGSGRVDDSVLDDCYPLRHACRVYLGCMGPDCCKDSGVDAGDPAGNDCTGEGLDGGYAYECAPEAGRVVRVASWAGCKSGISTSMHADGSFIAVRDSEVVDIDETTGADFKCDHLTRDYLDGSTTWTSRAGDSSVGVASAADTDVTSIPHVDAECWAAGLTPVGGSGVSRDCGLSPLSSEAPRGGRIRDDLGGGEDCQNMVTDSDSDEQTDDSELAELLSTWTSVGCKARLISWMDRSSISDRWRYWRHLITCTDSAADSDLTQGGVAGGPRTLEVVASVDMGSVAADAQIADVNLKDWVLGPATGASGASIAEAAASAGAVLTSQAVVTGGAVGRDAEEGLRGSVTLAPADDRSARGRSTDPRGRTRRRAVD
jgi:hypothetical protein